MWLGAKMFLNGDCFFFGGVFLYLLRDDGRHFHVLTALGVTGWGADAQYCLPDSCKHSSTYLI